MRKVTGPDAGQLYAMKVLKKATLKGKLRLFKSGKADISLMMKPLPTAELVKYIFFKEKLSASFHICGALCCSLTTVVLKVNI